jgi:preprotein translocase subunit SecE
MHNDVTDETRKLMSETGTALGSPSRDGSDGGDSGGGRGDGAGGAGGGGRRRNPERPNRIRNIGTFYKQVIAELRKVIWPTRKELVTYTTVVVVFVLVMVAIVAVFDLLFGKGVLAVFGQ